MVDSAQGGKNMSFIVQNSQYLFGHSDKTTSSNFIMTMIMVNVQGDLYLACEIFLSEKAYNFSLDPYLEKSLGQS